MEKFMPDMYQKSIHTINYDKLYESGIRFLLFDLDNTIACIEVKKPNQKLKKLFNNLQKKGFKIIIFSNAFKNRIKPFAEELKVEYNSRSGKPKSRGFIKIMKKYNFEPYQTALIGDQLLTDVKGGNKVGITTILINPISSKEFIFTKVNRIFERRIFAKMSKQNLFIQGRYYE